MSYGYRREPFGNQARVSHNHGKTWSDPITLSDDGVAGDLRYPSTVELGDSMPLIGCPTPRTMGLTLTMSLRHLIVTGLRPG